MTLTPAEKAEVEAKKAEADKANAEAEKARAETEKTRADAEKTRADAEQVRSTTEAERLLAQNKLDVASADLDAKRIANDAARQTARDTHTDKLIEQFTGAVPDLSSIGKSTVSFRDGKAMRQGESTAIALKKVVGEIATKVADIARGGEIKKGDQTPPPKEVFVVNDPGLVTALAGYRQLAAEATVLKNKVEQAVEAAEGVLPTESDSPRRGVMTLTATAAAVGAAVAGKAITELASLFELDVDVAMDPEEISAITVQAALIGALLNTARIQVVHETARIPTEDESALLKTVQALTASDVTATSVGARLDAAIKRLGDPAGELAQGEKDLKEAREAKDADAEEKANTAITAAKTALGQLKDFQNASTDLTAILEKARTFADRVVKAPDTGGPSLLSKALSVEPLATRASSLVLVVGAGKAETYQVAVKRRILFPRIQTSTSVSVDFLLVEGRHIVAGGHETGAVTYAGKISGSGAKWDEVTDLEPTGPKTQTAGTQPKAT